MYGLTEAFRSTYLPPAELDRRPDSIGKAIPNAEVLVLRPDGTPCAPDEPGELVHRGALVALGYWNDPAKTAERFKPVPGRTRAAAARDRGVVGRHGAHGRRGLPVLHRPPRRDDQDLGLPRQPDRGRGGGVRAPSWSARRPRSACRIRRWARRSWWWPCAARRQPLDAAALLAACSRACRPTWCRPHRASGDGQLAAQPERQDRPQAAAQLAATQNTFGRKSTRHEHSRARSTRP